MPTLPPPRGPLSSALSQALRTPPSARRWPCVDGVEHPLADEDLQLALYCCYELHYRGFDEVDEIWEWEPSLLGFRADLEARFIEGLCAAIGPPRAVDQPIDLALRAVSEQDNGPSLSRYLEREGSVAQFVEFFVHRSAYNLKEADPHSWAIPRLEGPAKAALVEIQADEYGGGRHERMHARLFADAMRSVGLDPAYGAYLAWLPGVTLATVNLMSLLGLHRRFRGALCGHLALFEMTSSVPNRRYGNGMRRLGLDSEAATAFFDEHVEADAVHEQIAAVDLAGGLVRAEPRLAADVLWGARALAEVERRWAVDVVGAWSGGRSSLLQPVAAPAVA